MLLANVGAYGYFMMHGAYMSGLTMLASTTILSSVMGVTLTMAIGGKRGSFVTPTLLICPLGVLFHNKIVESYFGD
ncbi:hypothetical protein DPMN_022559 [Dreissena polymorpha]|uniref:Uncharacterized protein n=1 Tax=Dreissena polymorpha TaxID=45954 RepID=A0A9D4NPK5_DREPO|nr:hypothetical protein DPMN_022559 [Dreissena polymorpha]